MRPYIGLSALQSAHEVIAMLDALRDGQTEHKLHTAALGFAADERTVRGEVPPSRRKIETLGTLQELVSLTKNEALAVVHYDTRRYELGEPEGQNLSALYDFFRQGTGPLKILYDALDESGSCDAFQVNGVCAPQLFDTLKKLSGKRHLILQLRPEEIQLGWQTVIQHLQDCREAISAVLYDPSRGQGRPFSAEKAKEVFERVKDVLPDMHMAFAGGWSPENVSDRVQDLCVALGTRDFSIDAESRLRDTNDNFDAVRGASFYQNGRKALQNC